MKSSSKLLMFLSVLSIPIIGFAKEPGIDGLFGVQLGAGLLVEKKEIIRDNQKQFMSEFRIPSPSSYPSSLFHSLKIIVNGKGKVASISGDVTVTDMQTCNKHRDAIHDWMRKQYGIDGTTGEYIYQFETPGRLRLAGARCFLSADLSAITLNVDVMDRILIEQIEHAYANRKAEMHEEMK